MVPADSPLAYLTVDGLAQPDTQPDFSNMSTTHHYHPFSKLLHWTMGVLWISAWFAGFMAVHFRDQLNPHHGLTIWHKGVAISLVFLIVVRVSWRLMSSPPPLPDTMGAMMQRAAVAGHIGLYGLALIALPMSGWALSSVANKPVIMFGLVQIPPFLPPNKELVELLRSVHTILSWVCGAMVMGHVLIAFKHHFIDKDGVLQGMLPRRKSASN